MGARLRARINRAHLMAAAWPALGLALASACAAPDSGAEHETTLAINRSPLGVGSAGAGTERPALLPTGEPNRLDVFPSLRYAGRRSGDPLGALTSGERSIFEGELPQRGIGRWGDYSAMVVDEVDGCTFWYTGQYVDSAAPTPFGFGTWATRIATFRFPGCPAQERGERHTRRRGRLGAPELNVDGIAYGGALPADAVGDVGLAHYVQATNAAGGSVYAVFEKRTGQRVAGPTRIASHAPAGSACSRGLGDPIVLWDSLAQRWLLSEIAQSGVLCVLVSRTADPFAATWSSYTFVTPEFPDFPKLAVYATESGGSAYLATTSESSPAIYAFDRDAMLQGRLAGSQRFVVPRLSGFAFQALTPADLDGRRPMPAGSPAVFVRHVDDELHDAQGANAAHDYLELFSLSPSFSDPDRSVLVGPERLTISEFDSALCASSPSSCFRQPAVATRLDPIAEVVMWRVPYRRFPDHESIVGNFVTDRASDDVGAVRWFELRRRRGKSWRLHQEGTWSPDSANRWLGSIAMDRRGNIALGYSVSSSDSPLKDPFEPNDTPATATAVVCGFVSESAALEPRGDFDYFSAAAPPGTSVLIDIDAVTDGSALDSIVVVSDPSGAILAFNDDALVEGQPPSTDSYLAFRSPADGRFNVQVSAFGLSSGPYTLRLTCGEQAQPQGASVATGDLGN